MTSIELVGDRYYCKTCKDWFPDHAAISEHCTRVHPFSVDVPPISAEALARRFHETYERLAPEFAYETREASAKPWDEVPDNNKQLMIAVCAEILDSLPG